MTAPAVRRSAAFGHCNLNLFQVARLLSILGMQMQSVAIGWQIYSVTHRPLDLAWVGLAQFLPAFALSLVTGHASDRFDRRMILAVCHTLMALLALSLFSSRARAPRTSRSSTPSW